MPFGTRQSLDQLRSERPRGTRIASRTVTIRDWQNLLIIEDEWRAIGQSLFIAAKYQCDFVVPVGMGLFLFGVRLDGKPINPWRDSLKVCALRILDRPWRPNFEA
jgi:hypothetical protein